MSLSKKVAALVLLAAVPNLAQSTQHSDREIEINVEPNSNFEIMLEHRGFLDPKNDPATILDNVPELDEKDIENGYSLAIDEENEDEEKNFECDCDQNDGDHDEYDADYGQVVVESQVEEVNNENEDFECHCHEADGQDDKADQDYAVDYDEIFVESEEETQEKEPQNDLPNDENENQECDCDQNDGDHDEYDADYGQVVVESQVEEVNNDKPDEQIFLPDQDEKDKNEDFECHCHDNDDQEDKADQDYDADYGQVFVENEGDDMKDEQSEVNNKQSNLRTSVASNDKDENLDEDEEVAVLVTYDQIMATLSEEEKDVEAATGEPFYKRMVDLILGKETQKELEAAHILSHDDSERKTRQNYYDGL